MLTKEQQDYIIELAGKAAQVGVMEKQIAMLGELLGKANETALKADAFKIDVFNATREMEMRMLKSYYENGEAAVETEAYRTSYNANIKAIYNAGWSAEYKFYKGNVREFAYCAYCRKGE